MVVGIYHKVQKSFRVLQHVRRLIALATITIIAMFGIAFYWGNAHGFENPFNPYSYPLGQLTLARTAQTPDEVAHHVTVAKRLLLENGSLSWLSNDKNGFEVIQGDLDNMIVRADNISSLQPENEVFLSEMTDMHMKIDEITDKLQSVII